MQPVRMTMVQEGRVPILDLRLRCGQKVLEVSLWRDEALSELYVGDEYSLLVRLVLVAVVHVVAV